MRESRGRAAGDAAVPPPAVTDGKERQDGRGAVDGLLDSLHRPARFRAGNKPGTKQETGPALAALPRTADTEGALPCPPVPRGWYRRTGAGTTPGRRTPPARRRAAGAAASGGAFRARR